MSNSKRWTDLKRDVDELRAHFLPETFHPLGVYQPQRRVSARTRAFLVLTHAEIECYLEEWAKEIAQKCERVWTIHGRFCTTLAFLLATSEGRVRVPARLTGSPTGDTPVEFKAAVRKLLQAYYSKIRDNHGIKEQNVLGLFAPLGAPATAFGTTLLPNLDSFGSLRGEYAHLAGRVVQAVPDPETEYGRAMNLVDELAVLDRWLVGCRRRIR